MSTLLMSHPLIWMLSKESILRELSKGILPQLFRTKINDSMLSTCAFFFLFLKRFIRNSKKTAFIVEHDFIMATYMADRVIVFEGTPARSSRCSAPQSLLTGINLFLKHLNITFRRDRNNFRPRINKPNGFKVPRR